MLSSCSQQGLESAENLPRLGRAAGRLLAICGSFRRGSLGRLEPPGHPGWQEQRGITPWGLETSWDSSQQAGDPHRHCHPSPEHLQSRGTSDFGVQLPTATIQGWQRVGALPSCSLCGKRRLRSDRARFQHCCLSMPSIKSLQASFSAPPEPSNYPQTGFSAFLFFLFSTGVEQTAREDTALPGDGRTSPDGPVCPSPNHPSPPSAASQTCPRATCIHGDIPGESLIPPGLCQSSSCCPQ